MNDNTSLNKNTSVQCKPLFSIGYATKPIEEFVSQLLRANINAVADIRSVPYSKRFHHYHREALQHRLKQTGIAYVYLGLELGPRSKDPQHYNQQRQVQFDRLMTSSLFQQGITRLFDGMNKGYCIALCCAEKDPAICHRSLLVGWALKHQYTCELQHIRHDGAWESQTALEQRLLQMTDTVPDMLMDATQALRQAWQRQCQAYAYRIPPER